MAIGLFLLSRLDVGTSTATSAAYLLVLGIGLGSVMQVLVLAVQNAVDYADARRRHLRRDAVPRDGRISGDGGVWDDLQLAASMASCAARWSGTARASGRGGRSPDRRAGGARCRPAVRSAYQHAYVHALRSGVRRRRPVLHSWGSPSPGSSGSARLARDGRDQPRGLDDGLAAPRSPDSLAEVERALDAGDRRRKGPPAKCASGSPGVPGAELYPAATWALVRISEHGLARARRLAETGRCSPPTGSAPRSLDELRRRVLVVRGDGPTRSSPTRAADSPSGAVTARRELLTETLDDESADLDPAIGELLQRLAHELAGAPPARFDFF